MKIDLSGKIAIVTGSTGGIGFVIAHGLAVCGATVVVNGRKRSAVDKATADMRSGAPEAEVRGVVADLSTANGCDALVKAEPFSAIQRPATTEQVAIWWSTPSPHGCRRQRVRR
ncbi:MAG: SDR family NAD(P)-dependent oxidoreductase [Stellaceae bacterium]